MRALNRVALAYMAIWHPQLNKLAFRNYNLKNKI